MNPIKSMLLLMLFALSSAIYSADSFEFNPQACTAHLDSSHIWFSANASNDKTGPELFADKTNADFFELVKTMINSAVGDNKTITLMYENTNNQNRGEYKKIIPEF